MFVFSEVLKKMLSFSRLRLINDFMSLKCVWKVL